MILILKTGSTRESINAVRGDYEDWFADRMELSESDYHVHYADNYEGLPPELPFSGIVITGSPLMVTELKLESSKLIHWLKEKQRQRKTRAVKNPLKRSKPHRLRLRE